MKKAIIIAVLGLCCTPVVFVLVEDWLGSPVGAALFSLLWLAFVFRQFALRYNLEKVRAKLLPNEAFVARYRIAELVYAVCLAATAVYAVSRATWWLAGGLGALALLHLFLVISLSGKTDSSERGASAD